MNTYNLKKFFKGEKLWTFDELNENDKEEYTYITSDCVVVKTKQGTTFWLEAKENLKFTDWDARHNEEKVKEISHRIFESDIERSKATISNILLQEKNIIKRVMFTKDTFKQINNKYIENMNGWYNIKCEVADGEEGAFYFSGPEYEIAILPMKNIICKDVDKFVNIVKGAE